MKRKRFTAEQIIAVLREDEAGAKTGDLARKHGVSEAIMDGRQPEGVTLPGLMSTVPSDWREQQAHFLAAAQPMIQP